MTSIDTIYEYAGYKLSGTLSGVLSSLGIPLILALIGVAYTVHLVAERGTIRPLILHILYLIFAAWMLGMTRQQDVPAPRFVAYAGQATDLLQKRMVSSIAAIRKSLERRLIALEHPEAAVLTPKRRAQRIPAKPRRSRSGISTRSRCGPSMSREDRSARTLWSSHPSEKSP